MNVVAFLGAIEIGLVYGLVALGVFLSFRVLNFPDLTVDGSFPLGAAVAAALIVDGVDPFAATAIAIAAAVPVPDPVFGEKVCLCAQLVRGASLTLEELVARMTADGVSREWLPERLILVDAMPRSAGEKVDKQALRQIAATAA